MNKSIVIAGALIAVALMLQPVIQAKVENRIRENHAENCIKGLNDYLANYGGSSEKEQEYTIWVDTECTLARFSTSK